MVEKKIKEEPKEQKITQPVQQPIQQIQQPIQTPNSKSKSFIFGAIILIILIAGVLFYFQKSPSKIEDKTAATVNGMVIKQSEVDKLYDSLPESYKLTTSKETILNQLIEKEVLFQEAKKSGITLSESEVKNSIDSVLEKQGISEEDYIQMLAQQNITKEELFAEYQKRLTIEEYLKGTLLKTIPVTDKEIKNYYDTNKEQFKLKEQVTVRHILFSTEELPEAEQEARANSTLLELNEKNFCEYVSRYSTDKGSLENCGEYTFSKDDPYVQEFKDLSFKQASGKIGIVKTQFGYHIIWTVKKTPAKTLQFNDAKDNIKQAITAQKTQELYPQFYEELKQKNDIKIEYVESAVKN